MSAPTLGRVLLGLGALTVLVGATFAFLIVAITETKDNKGAESQRLRHLKTLDATLDVQALRAITGLTPNYDDVAAAEGALLAQRRQVFEKLTYDQSDCPAAETSSATLRALCAVELALKKKRLALDDLKMNAAVGKNAREALLTVLREGEGEGEGGGRPELERALLRHAWHRGSRRSEDLRPVVGDNKDGVIGLQLDKLLTTDASAAAALEGYSASGTVDAIDALIRHREQEKDAALDATTFAGVALGSLTFLLLAAITAVIRLLYRARAAAERTRIAAERFVPPGLLRALGRSSVEEVAQTTALRHQRAVLYVDMRNHTTVTMSMPLEQLFGMMNRYLATIGGPIREHDGVIIEYRGDGALAVFDTPCDAVDAALGMIDALEREFGDMVAVGIGVHCGEVMIGTFGDELGRMNAGVVGEPVNLAARIEGQTKVHHIPLLVSEAARAGLPRDDYVAWPVANVLMVNSTQPLRLFEITDATADCAATKRDALPSYEAAMRAFVERDFHVAEQLAAPLLEGLPHDAALTSFVDRCRRYRDAPPPPGWGGIEVATSK